MKNKTVHTQLWIAVLLSLVVILSLAACGGQTAPGGAVAEAVNPAELPVNVDPATVEQIRNRDDVVILDVREDWEYQEGHIPGAVLIPLGTIPNRLDEIPRDKTVIAVCRSGNRSSQATQFLRSQGFDNVHNMTGGMIDWTKAGYETER